MIINWVKKSASPVIYILSGMILGVAMLAIQSFSEKDGTEYPDNERPVQVAAPCIIPDEMTFAGEPVPLKNFDTRESLDKELLVNAYWHSHTLLVLKKTKRYFAIIEPILEKYGIPSDFKYIPMAESNFENSRSPAGATGVWQIMEGTAREYGLEVNNEVDERYHLEKSTEVACKFFLKSYEQYKNWTLAAASYNVGRKGIDNQIERQQVDNYYNLLLNEETARYVFRILAFKLITEDPQNFSFHIQDEDYYPVLPFEEVKVDTGITNIARFAGSYSINYKLLKLFNPWLRDNHLTNKSGKTYLIKIPLDSNRNYADLTAGINEEPDGGSPQ
ncbi:MAG: transglycosylase SLT domain-containing protein [Bacteroidales bacterium]|nr:transglycosylase SLT domain-containing protein [Bacteroidales bacterium]MBN2763019.1 transglycosylase SLT domain-containing protein [Bacteroidales bacterium]